MVTKTKEEILEIIDMESLAEKDPITDNSKLEEDLGLDSLDFVQLIMNIESACDISIMDEDAESWKTVGDVMKYLTEKEVIT